MTHEAPRTPGLLVVGSSVGVNSVKMDLRSSVGVDERSSEILKKRGRKQVLYCSEAPHTPELSLAVVLMHTLCI